MAITLATVGFLALAVGLGLGLGWWRLLPTAKPGQARTIGRDRPTANPEAQSWLDPVAQAREAVLKAGEVGEPAVVARLALGATLLSVGRSQEAIAEYRQVTRRDPDRAEAYLGLGRAYSRSGDLAEAAIAYRQTLALNPGSAIAHYNLANALAASGQTPAAIAEYRAAIAREPNFPEAQANLAAVLLKTGDRSGAQQAAAQARSLLARRGETQTRLEELWQRLSMSPR